MRQWIWVLSWLLGQTAWASESLMPTLNVSDAFEARSVFQNPAALGFQTALNGAEVLTAFNYGLQDRGQDEFTYAMSYGYFGFGIEHQSEAAGKFSRYSLALGSPIGPYLYSGTRFTFASSDNPALRVNSLDLGIQLRTTRYFSFGVLAERLNRPTVAGVTMPSRYGFGGSLRPVENFDLAATIATPSDRFFQHLDYSVVASWEPKQGIFLRAGYDSQDKLLVGLQINFGRAALETMIKPDTSRKSIVTGLQFSLTPKRTNWKPQTALKVEINDSLREAPVRGGFFGKDRPGLIQLIALLDKARTDDSVRVVIVKLDGFPLGLAAAQDVHDALWRLREQGKRIEVFLSNAGITEYLIASTANEIHMEPTAELRTVGLKAERYFIKGTLDKLGVQGEFLAQGKYKSAPEMFTRTDSSPMSREEIMRGLTEAEKQLLAAFQKTGRIDAAKWKRMQQEALFSAAQAKEFGLVDTVDEYAKVIGSKNWKVALRENLKTRSNALALPPRVAVVIATGDILQDRVQLLSLAGREQITPARMERLFKSAVTDPRTDAIVMRVSSGGGEVLASNQIASTLEVTKKDKPVFVSMGDVAASGGYFISAPASKIFVQPLTLTGSIGVFMGKFNLGGLYKKIELNKEVLTKAPFGALMSENKPWTKEELVIMNRRLNQYYDGFVEYVALKRNLMKTEVLESAQGHVWLGSEARDHRLVDETTGYYAALVAAAKASGYELSEMEIWPVEDPRGPFDIFGDDNPMLAMQPDLSKSLLLDPDTLAQIGWLNHMRQERALYLSPLEKIE